MFKILSILVLTLSALPIFAADNYACSPWTKQDGYSCIFAGESANIYKRQCENDCHGGRNGNGNMGPDCDMEVVCHFNSPDSFPGVCSDWAQLSGVTCYDPTTQSWEQEWVRACTVGLRETWCSHVAPLE